MSDTYQGPRKQAVTGFKILNYGSKKAKEGIRFRIVIEAELDSIGAGEFDMGAIQKALVTHQDSETDIGFSLLMDK